MSGMYNKGLQGVGFICRERMEKKAELMPRVEGMVYCLRLRDNGFRV